VLQAFRKAKCQGSQNGRKSISRCYSKWRRWPCESPGFILFDVRSHEERTKCLYSISLMGNPHSVNLRFGDRDCVPRSLL
jgi:hypothetical protein